MTFKANSLIMDSKKEFEVISKSTLFMESSGTLKIYARLFQLGEDLQIFLYAGKLHIGAMVLASSGEEVSYCSARGHRDYEPALKMATHLSFALSKRVGISCGIHFDNLKRSEIAKIMELCERLTERLICFLTTQTKRQEHIMLDVNDLDKFAQFIQSGALEEKFKCGSEETRHSILELLEKLMDTAELADECATRLIFRGLKSVPQAADDAGVKNL